MRTTRERSATIREQLQAAIKARGLSVRELLERSKLPMSRANLDRQLRGDVPMDIEVAEVIAQTIDATLRLSKRRAA